MAVLHKYNSFHTNNVTYCENFNITLDNYKHYEKECPVLYCNTEDFYSLFGWCSLWGSIFILLGGLLLSYIVVSFHTICECKCKKYVENDNTVAGLFNSFGYCGAEAARMTADIFSGKTTINETIPRPSQQTAFINLKAAKRLNLPVSFEVLEAVDLIVK